MLTLIFLAMLRPTEPPPGAVFLRSEYLYRDAAGKVHRVGVDEWSEKRRNP
jgi:hypothetical protein